MKFRLELGGITKRMEHVSILFRRVNRCDPVPCNISDLCEAGESGTHASVHILSRKCEKGRNSLVPPHMRLYTFSPPKCSALTHKHSSTISRWKIWVISKGQERTDGKIVKTDRLTERNQATRNFFIEPGLPIRKNIIPQKFLWL